jgi:hypothetical protein
MPENRMPEIRIHLNTKQVRVQISDAKLDCYQIFIITKTVWLSPDVKWSGLTEPTIQNPNTLSWVILG